ncbi:MAG TPA: GntR family transcriptional regulator [Devosia sp.]|nr:GntR family transcriptional regulator [Devosia sp.]
MPNPDSGSRTLRAEAYDRIISLLNVQDLRPGQIVTQRELVERTKTSLAAVREAIPRLEAEGLMKTLRQRGLMITNVDVSFVRNACQLRTIIELEAVANANRNIPPTTIEQWEEEHRSILERLQRDTTEELAREAQQIDWSMHDQLIASLSNDLISEVYRVNSIKVRMAAHERLLVTPFNARRVMSEHLAILEALKAQDSTRAATAMRQHLANSLSLALGGTL